MPARGATPRNKTDTAPKSAKSARLWANPTPSIMRGFFPPLHDFDPPLYAKLLPAQERAVNRRAVQIVTGIATYGYFVEAENLCVFSHFNLFRAMILALPGPRPAWRRAPGRAS